MNKRNVAYFGSPDFAASLLQKIIQTQDLPIEIVKIFTQPDRPVGRGGVLTPTPVKQVAEKYGLPVITEKLTSQMLTGTDLVLLYAYSDLIEESALATPKYGFWNIHPSLLPKYRGASPTSYPIMMGEQRTGVSLMQMDRELDHGPLLGQKIYQVSPTDTKKKLEQKLTEISYELFIENIKKIDSGSSLINQDHKLATFTRKLTKNDGFISYEFLKKALHNGPIGPEEFPVALKEYRAENSASLPQEKRPAGEMLYDYWRAMYDWPGIWTKVMINGQEKRLKLTKMTYTPPSTLPAEASAKAGLSLDTVQLEGKNEVDFKTFQKAYKIF